MNYLFAAVYDASTRMRHKEWRHAPNLLCHNALSTALPYQLSWVRRLVFNSFITLHAIEL